MMSGFIKYRWAHTHTLIVEEILLQGFPCFGMNWLMNDIWIFFVTWTLVVFRSMCLPVPQAHPAKILFAIEALHMIAPSILLDADVTPRTLECNERRQSDANHIQIDVVRAILSYKMQLFSYWCILTYNQCFLDHDQRLKATLHADECNKIRIF